MTVMDRARKYVARMPLAASGQRGHDTTFRVACCLVQGFGLSTEDALSILREYNAKLSEKWTEQELCHKIEDADNATSDRPRGYLISSGQFRSRITIPVPPPVVIWNFKKLPQGSLRHDTTATHAAAKINSTQR